MQWRNSSAFIDAARQPPELMHYGIRGQKWGVRNYQNEDGSLTPAGKQRYGGNQNGRGGLFGLRKKKEKNRDWKPEDAENLSDEELQKRNNRLNQERIYRDSTTPQWKKDAKQNAKAWRNEAIKRIFIGTATTLAVAAMTKVYKNAQQNIHDSAHLKLSALRQSPDMKKAIGDAIGRYSAGGSKTRQYNNWNIWKNADKRSASRAARFRKP